ncbi:hypothetical protein HY632_00280 [Candidatus Uhrbacteria bacterium]|nr:hypothetical protein [Candidatus Uhrbacteria bacterium]
MNAHRTTPHVLLGVTGSVAAGITPELVRQLASNICGRDLQVVATPASCYFWNPKELEAPPAAPPESNDWPPTHRDTTFRVWTDRDEWTGAQYVRGQDIPHIVLREWADVFCIAPCSANTLAKLAHGMSDNLLTSIARAWRRDRPIVLVPAMNTQMWEHPATAEHLATLQRWYPKCTIVDPIVKTLACGEHGVGAMASMDAITHHVAAAMTLSHATDPAAAVEDWHQKLNLRYTPEPGAAPYGAHVQSLAAALWAADEWWAEHGGC